MPKFLTSSAYRNDIDGLRAIAVLPVIAFHSGYMPNGYLGVDIFFVISGFLITGIIYRKLLANDFSLVDFYLRRTRRIIPLSLFVSAICLPIGLYTMLPDDLENLSQSVVATSLFANNVLQAITTKNYWDVVNEYKPLMHTWSLGVEEQYYLLYPFLFLFLGYARRKWLAPILIALTALSFGLFVAPFDAYQKFYWIPFRFFELSLGGLAAIFLNGRVIDHRFASAFPFALLALMVAPSDFAPADVVLVASVLLTVGVVASANQTSSIASALLANPVSVGIGKISFSLYMWHQPVLAFARYAWVQEFEAHHLIVLYAVTLGLSLVTYRFVEQPFRNKDRVSTPMLLGVLGTGLLIANAGALYLYQNAGVWRDVPELGISRAHVVRNLHAQYNDRIYEYDRDFVEDGRTKVLVIGSSFARDWANVLLESRFGRDIQISYIFGPKENAPVEARAAEADLVFWHAPDPSEVARRGLDPTAIWALGTKNFGTNNGVFYNYRGDDYLLQRTPMERGTIEQNEALRDAWGDRFLDYIGLVIDPRDEVPVFTPDGLFISQDTRHLTQAGARYFARLFEPKLATIFDSRRPRRSRDSSVRNEKSHRTAVRWLSRNWLPGQDSNLRQGG